MKKLFKPASLLLYILSIIVFFFVGLFIAKLTGAGKNQMLAGGAIVLFYGLVSSFTAFVCSLIAAYSLEHRIVILLNKILGVAFLLCAVFVISKINTREKKEDPTIPYRQKTKAAEAEPIPIDTINQLSPSKK